MAAFGSRTRSVSLVLAVLAAGCTGLETQEARAPETQEAGAAECALPSPELTGSPDRGRVRAAPVGPGEPVPGLALRDASATIVGFCLPSGEIPSPVPALEESGRRVEPIGGAFTEAGGEAFTYAYYPATTAEEVAVVREGTRLGAVRFPAAEQDACGLRATRPFRVVACGEFLVLDWRLPPPFAGRGVEALVVDVWERGDRRRLGFLLHHARVEGGATIVRFATRTPEGRRVALRLRGGTVGDEESGFGELVLPRPHLAELTLSGARG